MPHVLRYSPIVLVGLLVGCFNPDPSSKLIDMPTGTGFSVHTVNGQNGSHNYSVFVPRDYTPAKKYPTIVFLHGIGESGSDGKKCTTVGIGPAIANRNGNFPFIVVFPQAGMSWTGENAGTMMMEVLHDAEKQYSIDTDRVSLSGMSSGGEGTWVLGARYHTEFAALVPMGGFADYNDVPVLARIPIWCLHNSGDIFVPVGGSREMYKRIKEAGGDIRYTEYDQGGHDCWDKAYDEGELFTWLQQQRVSTRPVK